MKIYSKISSIVAGLIFAFIFSGCVDQEFNDPSTEFEEPDITPTYTIRDLKALHPGASSPGVTVELADSIIIEGYVTSSDEFGNFYKELVIQDSLDAITVMIDESYMCYKYPIGQKVYIKCGGLVLGVNYGAIKLGAMYLDNGHLTFGRMQGKPFIDQHMFRSNDNENIEPLSISLNQLDDGLMHKLVKIENVQFKQAELNTTWADADGLESVNHYIVDEDNNSLIVRTSGYAAFAADTIPDGNGYIVGIVSRYNDDIQFLVRNSDDAHFTNERFSEPIMKDFEDENLYSDGWTVQTIIGDAWTIGYFSSNNFAQCTNFDYDTYTNEETESWFISPELDLSFYNSPILAFETACYYSGPALGVRYSTDYSGTGNPNDATWTNLSPTLSSGSWNWVSSGNLSLPENTKYVAFIYYGSDNDGKTWEIDNIIFDDASKK